MDEIFKSNSKSVTKEIRLDEDDEESGPFSNPKISNNSASAIISSNGVISPASISVQSNRESINQANDDSKLLPSLASTKQVCSKELISLVF